MNRRMSWIMGLSAMGLAAAGWIIPRRRKSPMKKMMSWTNDSVGWLKGNQISKMLMKTGKRTVRGMIK